VWGDRESFALVLAGDPGAKQVPGSTCLGIGECVVAVGGEGQWLALELGEVGNSTTDLLTVGDGLSIKSVGRGPTPENSDRKIPNLVGDQTGLTYCRKGVRRDSVVVDCRCCGCRACVRCGWCFQSMVLVR
jgi:hypothetical protein